MGYEVTMLSPKDITPDNLKQFDAIVTGVRAYNIYNWLNDDYDILMNYVKRGAFYWFNTTPIITLAL